MATNTHCRHLCTGGASRHPDLPKRASLCGWSHVTPDSCSSPAVVSCLQPLTSVSVAALPLQPSSMSVQKQGGRPFFSPSWRGELCLGVMTQRVTQASGSVVSSPWWIFTRLQLSGSYCSACADRPGFLAGRPQVADRKPVGTGGEKADVACREGCYWTGPRMSSMFVAPCLWAPKTPYFKKHLHESKFRVIIFSSKNVQIIQKLKF